MELNKVIQIITYSLSIGTILYMLARLVEITHKWYWAY
tara:strand:- start:515 stop:628 length:114 start_codon:yes stop_codon:yes gene_type:complete